MAFWMFLSLKETNSFNSGILGASRSGRELGPRKVRNGRKEGRESFMSV